MTETCVRIYDDVVSKEWCKETVDYYEKLKNPYNDERNLILDLNINFADVKTGKKVLKKYV